MKQSDVLQLTACLLKNIRTEKGWSQKDVYANTSLNMSRIESGKVDVTLVTLKALCDFYNVSVEVFFERLRELLH